ncbi:MAG: glutamate--tRNA ligase [Bacilli bacterium]
MITLKDIADKIFPNINEDISLWEERYPERNLPKGAIVTRFAPSPTGFIHMGSLLTAFIARKCAKDTNGVFFIRIEDTDELRSVENGVKGIMDSLNHLNFSFSEGVVSESNELGNYGPYTQTKRKEIYHSYAKYLLINDLAYPCFCSEEDLVTLREKESSLKDRIGYYGKYAICRSLSNEEVMERLNKNIPFVIRFKSTGKFENKVVVNDAVKGKIEFPENDLDLVILKQDGIPTYHFAHVIDDHLMRTTHIIRGDEWLSSVPIHIDLFNALKFPLPIYAHLAPVLKVDGNGKRKLSKRKDPEALVSYYFYLGIPNEALYLYLMTIANTNFEAWFLSNPEKSIDEFTFDFKKTSKSGSLFDIDKLNNISKNFISKLPANDLYDRAVVYAKEFDNELLDMLLINRELTINFFNIERNQKKPRKDYTSYKDIKTKIWYLYDELFFKNNSSITYENIPKTTNYNIDLLSDYINFYNELDTKEKWYENIKKLAEKYNYATEVSIYKESMENFNGHIGDVCEMIRASITASLTTPDLYAILKLLTKEQISKRIAYFIEYLK